MAGKIIADTIQTENSFLQLNVGATQIATMNTSGIFSSSGAKMLGTDGSIGNSTISGATVSGNLSFDSTGTSGIRLPAANTLAFHTTGAEDMRIDSSGNVGIGTTSPTGKLNVVQNGTPIIGQFTRTDAGTGLVVAADSSGPYFRPTTNTAVRWNNSANSLEYVRIDEIGRIGANTSNPQAQLDVRSQINVAQASPYSASIQAVKASGFGYEQNAYRAVVFGPISGTQSVAIGFDPSTIAGGSFSGAGNEIITKRQTSWIVPNAGATDWQTALSWNGTAVTIPGALSKGSGSFRIDHPLPELEETHQLVHSFIEGPQADLIYRGVATLIAGKATVNIDTAAGMTEGTFEALCGEVQCFTTNESDWTAVRGKVVGNILTIEAQENTATSTISWMVIGERKDKHMMDTEWTDDNGKVIVEPLKPENVLAKDK